MTVDRMRDDSGASRPPSPWFGNPTWNLKDYQVPFRLTGNLDKLTLEIDRPELTPADVRLK